MSIESKADELFESYVPGWPRDAQLKGSLIERIADAIAETEVDPANGRAADQYAEAIAEELGFGEGEHWVAIRTIEDPLFGAHRWRYCPSCGHVDEHPASTAPSDEEKENVG